MKLEAPPGLGGQLRARRHERQDWLPAERWGGLRPPRGEAGEKPSIAERLKELNRLLEDKLITQEEYDELRLKILMDL